MDGHNDPGQPRGMRVSARMALVGAGGPFDLAVDLSIEPGSFVMLTGPSGAGKTTLLRIIAGLQMPGAGRIAVDGAVWCDTALRWHLPVSRRPIGFVFQDYALFPNMTAQGNIDYALGRRAPTGEARRLLGIVGLEALADARPAQLSGGQRQRLALIRALARRPRVLILDEPLSALDPVTRQRLQDELRRLHHDFGTTTLMVSHDPAEIARLADRVIRLNEGRVVADGPLRPGAAELVGEYLGDDAAGMIRVAVAGRIMHLPRGDLPPGLRPGARLPLAVTLASGQAGKTRTFTSRGGA